ncbi:hypothetical protein HUK80_09175 [Flavobacterium sp. MAH-1]|uniref:Tetratricopeptide repeat protein n=1 Tax=Flavobacterium agri TaxID=2743471 RepID=A0A7Y9C753_9FLAO|nr:hypothetical protein [Flavobacterium agri]NUY81064.1 hypothetical protein [Flavobacterium agri]NYA71088.1 hypothetical protein [Flavobacterium agri]
MTNVLFAQETANHKDPSPEAIAFLSEVDSLGCMKDTIGVIRILEDFEKTFPYEGLITRTNQALARLFAAKGMSLKAVEKLEYILDYKPETKIYGRNLDSCSTIFGPYYGWMDSKFNVSTTLVSLYIKNKDLEKAADILRKAETEYFPPYDCGNAIDMRMSELDVVKADYLIAIGNQKKALEILFKNFSNGDASMSVFRKLGQILLMSYTSAEIASEIEKGIRNSKISEKDDYGASVSMSLFGYEISIRMPVKWGNIRKNVKFHPRLLLLAGNEAEYASRY